MKRIEKYVQMALDSGAKHAQAVSTEDLVFDARTLLKCMYGCDDWGRNWTCPSAPNALKPGEAENLLRKYKHGVIIHTNNFKLTQDISFQIESQAFYDGYHLAFSMSNCVLCETCCFPAPCKFPLKARPPMEGLGIDVFATARKLGLPINVKKTKSEIPDCYALVLLE